MVLERIKQIFGRDKNPIENYTKKISKISEDHKRIAIIYNIIYNLKKKLKTIDPELNIYILSESNSKRKKIETLEKLKNEYEKIDKIYDRIIYVTFKTEQFVRNTEIIKDIIRKQIKPIIEKCLQTIRILEEKEFEEEELKKILTDFIENYHNIKNKNKNITTMLEEIIKKEYNSNFPPKTE